MNDVLHLRAPGNWINDPNGFIYYKGKYHLFYQHFPYAPVWGTMHWGHAVSEDLVHWEHLGVALFPTKKYDQNGVFSGSAIEVDGKLYLYYSAVRYLETDGENIHKSYEEQYETSQAMVISEDGFYFDNWKDKRQIIPVSENEEIANVTHTRDPKVWKDGEDYYMILGSTYAEQAGRVLFYKSKDALEWKYVNQYRDKRYGRILECPDLFRVGGEYVFIGSPMYLMEDGLEYANHVVCAAADFDKESCRLSLPGAYQFVDYGLDLYAAQTNVDSDGRRVMIAWVRMPKAVEEPGKKPWNGMMCIPRVVEVADGHICFRVHPEIEKFFEKEISTDPAGVENPVREISCPSGHPVIHAFGGRASHDKVWDRPYRIKTVLREGEEIDIGGYRICVRDGAVKTDRSRVFDGIKGYRLQAETPKMKPGCGEGYELDIFVDKNIVEVFVNNGQYVISHVVYGLKEYIAGRIENVFTPLADSCI